MQEGSWATGVSSVTHARGQPNLLDAALPACVGVVSVAASALLWAAVLPALVLRVGEARQAAGPAESWAVRSEGLAASD